MDLEICLEMDENLQQSAAAQKLKRSTKEPTDSSVEFVESGEP